MPAPIAPRTPTPVRLPVVLTLASLTALATLATNIVLPSLPGMADRFAVSEAAMNGALGVFLAVFALAQLVVGPWSDRVGRQPVLIAGFAAFLAGSLVCALATTLPTLLVGRAIQALGAAAGTVLARAIARDIAGGPALVRLIGLMMVVMAAAPGFSPLAGSLIDRLFGWRAVFVALGIAGLAIAAATLILVGETHPIAARRVTRPLAILKGYAALVVDPRFRSPAIAVSLIMGALYAMFAATPILLARELGFDSVAIGVFFGATVFVVFTAGTLVPRVVARFGSISVLLAGEILATTGGLLLLGLALAGALTAPTFGIAVAIFLAGMGLAMPVGTATALTPFATAAGQASALLGFLQMTFAALAATLATALSLPAGQVLGLILTIAPAAALLVTVRGRPPERGTH